MYNDVLVYAFDQTVTHLFAQEVQTETHYYDNRATIHGNTPPGWNRGRQ